MPIMKMKRRMKGMKMGLKSNFGKVILESLLDFLDFILMFNLPLMCYFLMFVMIYLMYSTQFQLVPHYSMPMQPDYCSKQKCQHSLCQPGALSAEICDSCHCAISDAFLFSVGAEYGGVPYSVLLLNNGKLCKIV